MFRAMGRIGELESGKADHAARAQQMSQRREDHTALDALRERVMRNGQG